MSALSGRGELRHSQKGSLGLLALVAAITAAAAMVAILVDRSQSPPQTASPRATPGPTETAGVSKRPGRRRYVAPRGSDRNPGTKSAPWRTIAKAIRAARPGDTVVLGGGTYGARGTTTTADASGGAAAPITFMGHRRHRPRILGHFKITGDNLRFTGLLFDGPTGQVNSRTTENPKGEQVQVTVEGDIVEISHSEIRGSDWHAGIFLTEAEGARIVANYIHDNGDTDPCCYQFQENASHGIYFSSGSGLIANNVIEHNLARGVQLYKSPHDVLITHNTIVGNGKAGVQIAADSSNNVVANNVVVHNRGSGIRSDSLSGESNLAVGNLLWDNREGNVGPLDPGLSATDNLLARPRFAGGRWVLAPRSPGVDDALDEYGVPRDRRGRSRPRGNGPDIGAYEVR